MTALEPASRSLDYPELPVGSLLAGAARRYGNRVAIHFGERDLTVAALHERACAFANALGAAGIGRGDVVAVHLPNCPQYAIAYYGILLSGATFSPANPLLPPTDLGAQLADCGAVAAVTWGPAAPALAAVRDRTAIRLVLVTDREQALDPAYRVALQYDAQDFEAFHADAPTTAPIVAIDVRADLAHLAYTGGTTGRSKGVRLPHRNVVVNALQYSCWGTGSVPALDEHGDLVLDQVGSAEEYPVRLGTGRGINLTPWFHAMGTIGALSVPVLTGGTTVLHERFEPGAYLADAERFRVTNMGGAPPLYGALLQHPDLATRDLSSVRLINSGAAPLPVEMIEALRRRFGADVVINEGYGLTEVTMGATIGPAARSAVRKVGTVGLPVYRHRGADRRCRGRRPGGASGRGARRGVHPWPPGDGRLPRAAGGDRGRARGRLAAHWRHRRARRGRLPVHRRPQEGHAALQGLQRVPARAGGAALRTAGGGRGRGGRAARPDGRRATRGLRRSAWPRRAGAAPGSWRRSTHSWCPTGGCASCTWWTRSRCLLRGRCSSVSCGNACPGCR